MKRALVIAAVLGVLGALPATAGAASWRGTIVAKQRDRGTVVTVSPSGVARTLRALARVQKLRVGQRVAVKARRLADGTFKAQAVRVVGRAKHARIRATVVRQRTAGRLVVSAGGSTFALRSRNARRVSSTADSGLAPGDEIVADVSIEEEEVDVEDVNEVGAADLLELSGTFGSFSKGILVINAGGGPISITVPGTITLPTLSFGDEVELLVSVGAGNVFILSAINNEGSGDEGDQGDKGDQGVDLNDDGQEVEVKGTVLSVPVLGGAQTIVVQPGGNASPVTCAVSGTVNVKVGQTVELQCELVSGTLTLTEVQAEDDQSDDELAAETDSNDDSGPGGFDEGSGDSEGSGSGSGEGSGDGSLPGGEVDD